MTPRRHSWLKLRIHVYICRRCGCGKVNAQREGGAWFATFHLPTGASVESRTVPACEVGPMTAAALGKHRDAIGGSK